MIPITIGTDRETGRKVSLDPDLFRTHVHLLGATGSGKTTAIHTLIQPLLTNPRPKCCLFLVDPVGTLSRDLLAWMANTRLCPPHVRDRLLYIEPAREDVVLPFNPLVHESEDHLYYQVGRAVEIVLRAWASQNIEEMPRLRQWCFNSFFAAAAMGYPIAACRYLLRPGSAEHDAMLARLPAELRSVWAEILRARGSEAVRLLESTRNRLAPFFDSGILRRMFGSTQSRFDVERFICERRIVVLNVASYGRLDRHIAHTIGALAVNEVLQTAMNMTPEAVDPTYILLDEFQHFVGPDLFDALPLVRQLGLRLILSHQSFSQLEQREVDLSGLIWQARSRLMFANDADDADRIAHELATLKYDPLKLKDVLQSHRQRIAGHRREWLENMNTTDTNSHARDTQESRATGQTSGESRAPRQYLPTEQQSGSRTTSQSESRKESHSHGSSHGQSETLVPIHEDFLEISSKTYYSFDEQRTLWAQKVRSRSTGEAFGKFKDDPKLYDLLIDYHPVHRSKRTEEAVAELLEENFQSDFFLRAPEVERHAEELRQKLLQEPPIAISSNRQALPGPEGHGLQSQSSVSDPASEDTEPDPFR